MPEYLLVHQHHPEECRHVYAAWHGFHSPLRHHDTSSSCLEGDHRIVWTVDAPDPEKARALLPTYIADRTEIDKVRQVPIP